MSHIRLWTRPPRGLDMDGLTERLSLAPEMLAAASSAENMSMRLSLDGVPEGDRRAVFREVIGRELLRYDIEPLPDVPAEIDIKLQAMPGPDDDVGQDPRFARTADPQMAAPEASNDIAMVVNFNRAFRQGYGETPSGIRAGTIQPGS
jgi:hypothetical protein